MTAPRRVHFGIDLPQVGATWEKTRRAAEAFERLGYDSLWVMDHLFGLPQHETPILEAWTTLAAVGSITSRVELGTLVSPPGFRNPALLAKMVTTLDQITSGRMILGLGAGRYKPEYDGYGFNFPETRARLEQLAEAAEISRRAWTEPGLSFTGKHFRTDRLTLAPGPVRQPHPPLLIGGIGEKVTMRIAARFADIWNNSTRGHADLARKVQVMRQHCAAIGRDPAEITISQQAVVVISRDEDEAARTVAHATKLYGTEMVNLTSDMAIVGAPGRIVEQIEKHVALGCSHFIIEFYGKDSREPAQLFAETVIPHFR